MNTSLQKYAGWLVALSVVGVVLFSGIVKSGEPVETPASERLAIVWTSGDPEVAHRMCLMFGHAARKAGWFQDVTLVVWGPSSRLLAGDKDLQAKVQSMAADGVTVQACVVCADSYGVSGSLRELGIEVKPMGQPLADMLKGGWNVLTF